MILDDEVFAVIMALVIVGSVFGIAMMIPRRGEPFTAIGLLNEKGKIGDYPKRIVAGEKVRLQLFLDNHLGKAALLQARMKLGAKGLIPTEKEPLDKPSILNYTTILCDCCNTTHPVEFALNETGSFALVFELWAYNTTSNSWEYTGRWVHLYINMTGGVSGG